jgi:hypothetical protein
VLRKIYLGSKKVGVIDAKEAKKAKIISGENFGKNEDVILALKRLASR